MNRTFGKLGPVTLAAVALLAPAWPAAGDEPARGPLVSEVLSLPVSAPVSSEVTALDLWIEQQLGYRGLPGLALAVVRDQEVVFSRAYGWADREAERPMTGTTPFRMGSISKLFTATAVMQLRDRGKLRLDDPVATHLPWFSVEVPEGSPPITVRQLLTHTTGLPREASFPYWTDHVFPDRDQLIASLAGARAKFPPATRYGYSNLGMALLGEIVAVLSGQPWDEYLAEHVFEPLGMARSTADPGTDVRAELAAGYMRRRDDGSRGRFEYYDTGALAPAANAVSTLDDMTRFAALQFRESAAGEVPVLRASTLREMHRVDWLKPGWSSGRGLGWSVSERAGETIVSHGGWIAGNRSHLLLVPSRKVAVIALANADDGQPHVFAYEALDTLGNAGDDPEAPEPARALARSEWEPYFGLYADPWEWEYRVLAIDGDLVLYDYSYPPAGGARDGVTVLEPVSEHTFRMPDGGLVVFELDPDGGVERIQRRSDYIFPVERASADPSTP